MPSGSRGGAALQQRPLNEPTRTYQKQMTRSSPCELGPCRKGPHWGLALNIELLLPGSQPCFIHLPVGRVVPGYLSSEEPHSGLGRPPEHAAY